MFGALKGGLELRQEGSKSQHSVCHLCVGQHQQVLLVGGVFIQGCPSVQHVDGWNWAMTTRDPYVTKCGLPQAVWFRWF